jgi:putative hydrolase
MPQLLPLEDMHVHSTFSDGKHTVSENLAQAEMLGLARFACVDHVRIDSTYIPDFVAAVRRERNSRAMEIFIGVEAKILDGNGQLDLPSDLQGVDFIYAADHQFPLGDRCYKPREIRAQLEAGLLTTEQVIAALMDATLGVLHRYPRVVLAHLFSILPKIGLREAALPLDRLAELAWAAKCADAAIEIDERWRCPNARTLQVFRSAGVPILCSTDSHNRESIGVYGYVHEVFPPEALR